MDLNSAFPKNGDKICLLVNHLQWELMKKAVGKTIEKNKKYTFQLKLKIGRNQLNKAII